MNGSVLKNGNAIPQTYAAALLEAGRLAQLNEQQAEQLAMAAPKVEFVDKYVTADSGSKGFRQVAKLLCANEERSTHVPDRRKDHVFAGQRVGCVSKAHRCGSV